MVYKNKSESKIFNYTMKLFVYMRYKNICFNIVMKLYKIVSFNNFNLENTQLYTFR